MVRGAVFARAAFIKAKPGCEAGLTGEFEQEVVWARVVLEISLVRVYEISNSTYHVIE